MPPINNMGDALMFLLAIVTVVPILAAVMLLELWIIVTAVTLVLASEFLLAYGWLILFVLVLSIVGGVNQAMGIRR